MPAPIQPTERRHFIISDRCSPEQRKVFEAINQSLDILGISADDFDRDFRIQLMQQCMVLAESTETSLVNKVDANTRRRLIAQNERARHALQWHKNFEEVLGPEHVMEVQFTQPISDPAEISRLMSIACSMEPQFVSNMAHHLNNMIGRFQDIDQAKLNTEEHTLYQRFSNKTRPPLTPVTPSSPFNLLQECADGKPLANKEGRFSYWDNLPNVKFETGAYSSYISNALLLAMVHASLKKGWDAKTRTRKLQGVTDIVTRNMGTMSNHASTPPEQSPIPQPSELPATDRTGGVSFPDRYTYASNLPEPEKRFFDALNKVVQLTGENAVMFDHNLRLKMYTLQQSDSYDMITQLQHYFQRSIPGVQIESVMLGGELPTDFPASLKPGFKRTDVPRDPLELLEALINDMRNAELQRIAQRSMNVFMNERIPGFDQLNLGPSAPLRNDNINDFIRDTKALLGNDALKEYTGKHLLLESFAKGERRLHTLSARHSAPVTAYFEVSHAPLNAFLMEGIENTAHFLARDNGRDNEKLARALDELKAAYKDATLTPEEREAQQQAQREDTERAAAEAERQRQIRQAEEARRQEEALLIHAPYGMTRFLQSMQTRATRTNPPPEKELADAWNQISPLPNLLNKNFAPHQELGDVLFQHEDAHVLHVIDHICTGAPLPSMDDAIRSPIRNTIISMLSDPIENLAPQLRTPGMRERLIEFNRTHHQQVQEAFLQSPLLIIATLGTRDMIEEARAIQELLFPQKKREMPDTDTAAELRGELRQIAERALQHAFQEAGRPVPGASSVPAPVPPAPPQPPAPPAMNGNPMEWDNVRTQAERFVEQSLQRDRTNPYTMFRCRLGMEPGHPLIMELVRWVGNNTQPTRDTCRINRANLDDALDVKKRLQAYVLNLNQNAPVISQNLRRLLAATPLAPYRRRHHVGFYQAMAEDILPDTVPRIDPQRPEPDGQPGRVDNRGNGLWNLRLLFPDAPDTPGGPETITETFLSLGVEQAGSRDMANARRLMVLDHLQQLRERNQQHMAAGHPEEARRVTGQDLHLWLSQQIHALDNLSQGAQAVPSNDPALDRQIRALATSWQQPIPNNVTPRNWLVRQAERLGTRWDSIRVINLREHRNEFDRHIPINIPATPSGQESRLEIYFQNPEFSGVSQFWSVDVDLRLDGKSILKSGKRINMHISAAGSDGEPGSDTQQILDRLNAIRSFLSDALNAYGRTYPHADLHMVSTSPYLQQYSPQQLRNTPNFDQTRLDVLIDALPFTGTITASSIIPEGGMTPDQHNNTRFGIGIYREDGSPLHERRVGFQRTVPVVREYTMPIILNAEKAKNIITAFIDARYSRPDRPRNTVLRTRALNEAERRLAKCQSPEQWQRLVVNYFTDYTQHLLFNALDDKYSPFRDPHYEPHAQQMPILDTLPRPDQAMGRIVALMRHGPALQERAPTNGDELMNPIEKYDPRAIIKSLNSALDSAASIANAQQAGIQPLIPPAREQNGGNGGGDDQPGDPMHHHAPTPDQLEAVRGIRPRVGRKATRSGFSPEL